MCPVNDDRACKHPDNVIEKHAALAAGRKDAMRVKHTHITAASVIIAAVATSVAGVTVAKASLTEPEVITKHVTKHVTDLPDCQHEDSRNCIWRADERGNGIGLTFIDWEGVAYYADTPESDPDAEFPTGTRVEYDEELDAATAYGFPTQASATAALSEALGCDWTAPAALDQIDDTTWWAYCEPALGTASSGK